MSYPAYTGQTQRLLPPQHHDHAEDAHLVTTLAPARGVTLETLLARTPLDTAASLRLCDRVCAAVEAYHAHNPGLVIGSLSLETIEFDHCGRVWLTDMSQAYHVRVPLAHDLLRRLQHRYGQPFYTVRMSDIQALVAVCEAVIDPAPGTALYRVLAQAARGDGYGYRSVGRLRRALDDAAHTPQFRVVAGKVVPQPHPCEQLSAGAVWTLLLLIVISLALVMHFI